MPLPVARIFIARQPTALVLSVWLCIAFFIFNARATVFAQTAIPTQTPAPAQSPIASPSTSPAASPELEDFASKLIAATTDAARQTLLQAYPSLVNTELRALLQARGDREREANNEAQSLVIYRIALLVAERINDQVGISRATEEIALAYYTHDDYERALPLFRQILEIETRLGDRRKQAGTLNQIGMVYRSQGDYPQAVESYRRASEINGIENGEVGNLRTLFQTQVNLGIVYRYLGSYSDSLNAYRRAFAVLERLGDKAIKGSLSRLMNGVGNVYHWQGDYAQAAVYFEKSLRAAEADQDLRVVASALNNLGETYAHAGDYALAQSYYERSLTIAEANKDRRALGNLYDSTGNLARLRGDAKQALALYQKSLSVRKELKDKASIAESLSRIADVSYEMGDSTSALNFSERSAALSQEIGRREILWRARLIAGKALRRTQRTADARRAFDEAINVIESLRADVAGGESEQGDFFADKVEAYYQVCALLVAEKRYDEAFAYAERGKSRSLLDALRLGRTSLTKNMATDERARDEDYRRTLNRLGNDLRRARATQASAISTDSKSVLDTAQKSLDRARLEYAAWQTNLYAAHPQLRVQRGDVPTIMRPEINQLLPDNETAIIEYVVTDTESFAFVFTKTQASAQTSLKVYPLPLRRAEINARIADFRQQLARRSITFRAGARALYDSLLRPLEADLSGKKRIIIVPDDALWELPFQALQTTEERYLVERAAVSYAPSLTVLREMRAARIRLTRNDQTMRADKTRMKPSLLALGNPQRAARVPDKGQESLMSVVSAEAPDLPEAENQVRAILGLYDGRASRVYTGAEARETVLKAGAKNFDVLHLAAHGVLNNDNPLHSYILLAPESVAQTNNAASEDGMLEAREMMNLTLRARLVVLSACETGRGRVQAGEGIIGMSWALLIAGTPTVVVSQWQVESASTTSLMREFHGRLQPSAPSVAKNLSSSEALRQASLQLLSREQYAHPFYWAGFVLIGDGD